MKEWVGGKGVGRGGRSGPGGKEWAGGEGVGRGERSGPGGGGSRPGRIGLLYVMFPYCQDFLFDF